MTEQTTRHALNEIEARAAALYEYGQMDSQAGQNALDELTDTDVPALLAEVRRLQALVAELEPDAALLCALYAAGVDNWDGYDNAREEANARAELTASVSAAAGERVGDLAAHYGVAQSVMSRALAGVTWSHMSEPRRIKRQRTPGWRLADATTNPLGAVIVSRPSRFGNPFTIKDAIEAEWSNPHSVCAEMYGEWLRVGTEGGWFNETYRIGKQVFDRRRILDDLHLLRGRDLACTCPLPAEDEPDHCHAAVLLEIANRPAAAAGESGNTR